MKKGKTKVYRLGDNDKRILESENDFIPLNRPLTEADKQVYTAKLIEDLKQTHPYIFNPFPQISKLNQALKLTVSIFENTPNFENFTRLTETNEIIKARVKEWRKQETELQKNPNFQQYKEETEIKIKNQAKEIDKLKDRAKYVDYIIKQYEQTNPPPKHRKPTPPKPNPKTLNPNFKEFGNFADILEIIHKETAPLFNASLEQWKNLFSENIQVFPEPIELKQGIELQDLRLFLDLLRQNDIIKNGRFNNLLSDVGAFSWNGKPIASRQYIRASQGVMYPNTKKAITINEVINKIIS